MASTAETRPFHPAIPGILWRRPECPVAGFGGRERRELEVQGESQASFPARLETLGNPYNPSSRLRGLPGCWILLEEPEVERRSLVNLASLRVPVSQFKDGPGDSRAVLFQRILPAGSTLAPQDGQNL